MRIFLFYICSIFLVSCSSAGKVAEDDLLKVVKTEGGLISGTLSNGVYSYKGIPYAAPPVEELRWREPKPVKPWKDTLKCLAYGPSPIQNDPKPFMMWTQEFITPAKPLSEDCLYLNVWTPAKSPTAKLPVFVWIHGGGFTSGSAACPVYDGEALAGQGIVFVSINYRLGIFGFLAHPELSKESQNNASGNYGILDQIYALRWVKDNIASFGGDPNSVTIGGQSAGSMSVHAVVSSPLSKGLLHRAIAESGALSSRPSPTLVEAEQVGMALFNKTKHQTISQLRALHADTLLALGNKLPFGSFFPIRDGYVLPVDANSKPSNDVALLAGWVLGDADLMLRQPKSADAFRAEINSSYPSHVQEFVKLFPSNNDVQSKESQRKLALLQFAGMPDYTWATSNKEKSYLYQFSYVPTDKPGFPNYGAFHTSEVPFALHTLDKWDRPWKDQDRAVEKYMSAYWLNFIKNGDPNGAGLPNWTPFTKEQGNIMDLGMKPVLKENIFKEEFELLSKLDEQSRH